MKKKEYCPPLVRERGLNFEAYFLASDPFTIPGVGGEDMDPDDLN